MISVPRREQLVDKIDARRRGRSDKATRRQRIRTFAASLATIGVLAVWLVFLSPTGIGGPVGVIWVSGTSMEPGLKTGDLVITYEQDEYAIGDVVAFRIPQGGVIIHRIIEITEDGLYRFQGDNRRYEDRWELSADDIIGSRIVELHKAATIAAWLSQPLMLAAMVTIITFLTLSKPEDHRPEEDDRDDTDSVPAKRDDLIDLRVIDLRDKATAETKRVKAILRAIQHRGRH